MSMKNIDAATHTRGESVYLDDIPLLAGTLFGCAYPSAVAHGVIKTLDTSDAKKAHGVVKVFTSKDITGENQIGVSYQMSRCWPMGRCISAVCPLRL